MRNQAVRRSYTVLCRVAMHVVRQACSTDSNPEDEAKRWCPAHPGLSLAAPSGQPEVLRRRCAVAAGPHPGRHPRPGPAGRPRRAARPHMAGHPDDTA